MANRVMKAAAAVVALVGFASPARPAERAVVLDVPFVAQTEALCGGAASAMVLRYWGVRSVRSEDFASLLTEDGRGIETRDLRDALEGRGFDAHAFRGSKRNVQSHLSKAHPVLALLRVGPGSHHYVVLVGWFGETVVYHDPAVAPFRVVSEDEFLERWEPTRRWSMLVLPGETAAEPVPVAVPAGGPHASPCSERVREAVAAATRERLDVAERLLLESMARCPGSSAGPRELAGVRFAQGRFREAASLSERAVDLEPADEHAWLTLGASRYLDGDEEGALEAWNARREPRIDLVRIDGLRRTRHRVIEETLGAPIGRALTPAHLGLARRRASSLPTVTASRVGYRPVPGGAAELEVALVERSLLFDGLWGLAATAAKAAVDREISAGLSSPTGRGELVSAQWRYWEERPRAALSLAVPRLFGAPGVWSFEGSWERQSYGFETEAEAVVREERRRAALRVSDWASPDVRWSVDLGVDRWLGRGSFVSAGGGVSKRLAGDRLAVSLGGRGWLGDGASFGAGGLRAAWRAGSERGLLSLRGGLELSSERSPRDVWPGAGTGHARPILLRAHPLLRDGVLAGEVFGRTLTHAGAELSTRLWRGPMGSLTGAAFADLARASRGASATPSPLHVDVGAGIRVPLLGDERMLRVDLAYGLRDENVALSVGWSLPWPRFAPEL